MPDRVKEKLVELLWKASALVNNELPTVEQITATLITNGVTVQEWISVKDRLPEKDVKVLTFGVYGFSVNYRDRFSGKWRGVNGRSQWITHWMPLPQPPKGDG